MGVLSRNPTLVLAETEEVENQEEGEIVVANLLAYLYNSCIQSCEGFFLVH